MQAKSITPILAVSEQITPDDVAAIAAAGFKSILCNRPDGEGADQPVFAEIEAAAKAAGLASAYQPIISGKVSDADAEAFGTVMDGLPKPVFAYCRTGTRSATLWSLSEGARGRALPDILAATKAAGYDMAGVVRRIANGGKTPTDVAEASHRVVIIGGGAAGIAVASSLKARKPDLDIAIIDPADIHYYQPGWTMVGAGVFDRDHRQNHGLAHSPRRALDQGRYCGFRTGEQGRHPRWLPRRDIRSPDRRPRPQAQLGGD